MGANAELLMHPAMRCDAVRRIAVAIGRENDGGLGISWRIEGDIARLRLLGAPAPVRRDGLWQHSCFEAFLRADGADSYFEFNLAPSGAWAAYRFAAPRRGRESPELTVPRLESRRSNGAFDLHAVLPLAGLRELALAASIDAGLAAVIEDEHGTLSYWALAHRAPAPDFHDPATFLCRVGAP